MKIYILAESNYEGMDIEAVYSTREKAVEALPYKQYMVEDDIYEYDLDPENEGDIYETYYYCNYDPNAEKENIWGGTTKIKPSDFVPYEFIHGYRTLTQTQGRGKTPEEAEANARKANLELHPVWQVWDADQTGHERKSHLPHPSMVYTESYVGYCKCYAVHEDYNVARIAIDEYLASGKLSPFLTVVK